MVTNCGDQEFLPLLCSLHLSFDIVVLLHLLRFKITTLCDAAPRVAILVTSRERLKLREGHVFSLGGLDLPDSAASHSGAVELFTQHARLLRPGFMPMQDDRNALAPICRLVDGMPLAIELAAGWIDTLV